MKLKFLNKFWKRLCIFSYKQISSNPGLIEIGIPGIRDNHNVCKSYSPGQIEKFRGFNHCQGDGHYLCKKCRYYERLNAENENLISMN